MPKRLGKFALPSSSPRSRRAATSTYAKFIAEPFEAVNGHTVGNSSAASFSAPIEGSAISSIKIDG